VHPPTISGKKKLELEPVLSTTVTNKTLVPLLLWSAQPGCPTPIIIHQNNNKTVKVA
jgi:hypothetical protein